MRTDIACLRVLDVDLRCLRYRSISCGVQHHLRACPGGYMAPLGVLYFPKPAFKTAPHFRTNVSVRRHRRARQWVGPHSQCVRQVQMSLSSPFANISPYWRRCRLCHSLKYKAVCGMSGRLHSDHAYVTARRTSLGSHGTPMLALLLGSPSPIGGGTRIPDCAARRGFSALLQKRPLAPCAPSSPSWGVTPPACRPCAGRRNR